MESLRAQKVWGSLGNLQCTVAFVQRSGVEKLTIIIMYIYHALINAPSAHMIHINLNMIFYTHVEHSPTKNNLRKVLY